MNSTKIKTSVGVLGLIEVDGSIVQLVWDGWNEGIRSPALKEGLAQLDCFDLSLAPKGTEFQQQVYAAMLAIPYGQTRTYGEISNELNGSAQPVSQACASNLIPVIIPRHRVVGADGLGGFSGVGGVEMKVKLLQGEGAYSRLL